MRRTPLGVLVLVLVGCQARSPSTAASVLPAAVLVEPGALSLRAGESAQLSAQVNDALGQPIGGAPIAFETSDPGLLRVTPTGLASSTGSAGSARIVVTSGAKKAVVPVTITPGDVSRLQKLGGDGQRGAVALALEAPVSVKGVDAYGNAISGVRVVFSTPDGGAASPVSTATDVNGAASTTWTLGASPGVQRLSAALEGAPSSSERFTATAHAGAPARLSEVAPPGPPPAAGSEVAVRVRVMDGLGNAIPGAEVAWRAVSKDAAVSPGASATDAAGVAEVRVRTAAAAAINRVEARAAGLAQPLELAVATVAGPPARVEVVRGDRQSARANRPAPVNPAVRVVDANGNPVAGVPVRFVVTAGGGAVAVVAPVTDARGVASCGRWTLGGAGDNAVTAAVDGVERTVKLVATARRR
jgi:adhesin/invasin